VTIGDDSGCDDSTEIEIPTNTAPDAEVAVNTAPAAEVGVNTAPVAEVGVNTAPVAEVGVNTAPVPVSGVTATLRNYLRSFQNDLVISAIDRVCIVPEGSTLQFRENFFEFFFSIFK
jgi:hypothetical protein